jgi:hypothetical protein
MRKVKLELESLAVESFSIGPASVARGTVVGNAQADYGRLSADCSVVCTYDWDCTV